MRENNEKIMPITIKDKPESVIPYLNDVRLGADSAKEELGFLPPSAYETFATSGKLFVAANTVSGVESYAGHLMFGGLFPQAKVFQLFVAPAFRGQGVARLLLSTLKQRLTMGYWLSIVANVADDLPANAVYAQMGFQVVRTKPGGAARKRRINVRVLDLETPSLLTLMGAPAREVGLRLPDRYSQRPIYLIDLNVLFDVVRTRARSEAAAKVVWAGMNNSIRLMIADEFAKELERTSQNPLNDPILAFAKMACRLPVPPDKILRPLVSKLAPVIFPDRHRQGILKEQDHSDLKHIATAIHHRVAGFISSENAILRARPYLLETWDLDVVGVEEFAEWLGGRDYEIPDAVAEVSSGLIRTRRDQNEDLHQINVFLRAVKASSVFVAEALACQGSQVHWLVVVDGENKVIGFAKWDLYGGTKRTADVWLSVDESNNASEAILDHILCLIPRELSVIGPTLIRLIVPAGQLITRQAALANGFRPPLGAGEGDFMLQRLAAGRVVWLNNWHGMRRLLVSVASLALPAKMPSFEQASRRLVLKIGDQELAMSLPEVEQALSPVLFLFPGRDGVIVPIRSHFAEDLIGASPQMSLLAPPEVVFRRERVYVSNPKNFGMMKPDRTLLFYESQNGKGRGCVTAIARITGSRIVTKAEALDKVLQRGVLDQRTLESRSVGNTVAEVSFDNLFLFNAPVAIKRLKELGCADDSNLVRPRTISYEKLIEVVKEGRIDG